ncbi:MAG TPA: GDSL-type esterase/lipase family protein, partial [bacterium]|nr:GDSL-type esterase/lipase family protein [bacterium]
ENGFQHNEQGYRGTGVSLRKKPGVFRILCLGGSTTYGWGVSRPEEAYPALLEAVVKNRLPASVKGVEVINGGLPYGTTAEMLTHYHFKYHYYQPDLVILEAGGNDAEAFAAPFYHPDYSHWRQPLVLPQTLPTLTRKLMESRLASLFLIPMFYGLHPNRNNLQRPPSEPIAEWYDRKSPDIPAGEIALEYNLETLIDEILKDKAKVLLVPFRPAPHNIYPKPIQQAMILNEDILKNLASKRGLPLSPFPAEIISAQNWVDDCHLNAAGEKEKALHIASYVQKLI